MDGDGGLQLEGGLGGGLGLMHTLSGAYPAGLDQDPLGLGHMGLATGLAPLHAGQYGAPAVRGLHCAFTLHASAEQLSSA